ncbi:MAG: DUF6714 family protein [Pirellula sp.]
MNVDGKWESNDQYWRTEQCAEVADRAFPDGCFTGRNSVMVVVTANSKKSMEATALQCKFEKAFERVRRPARFTTCHCDECSTFDALLQSREYHTLTEADIDMSLCLMSPEGLVYWTPALVRLCLMRETDDGWEACNHFINSELGLPLPRNASPVQHPRFASLNSEQTILILEFLLHIEENWYTKDSKETPRELARAIRNWSRFAGVKIDTPKTSRNHPMDRSGGSAVT